MQQRTITMASAAALAILVCGYVLFEQGRQAGVRATVAEFAKADKEGAENVTDTSRRVLRDLGRVDDPVRLLCATDGLRDAECDND